jgi:hypothetical protein
VDGCLAGEAEHALVGVLAGDGCSGPEVGRTRADEQEVLEDLLELLLLHPEVFRPLFEFKHVAALLADLHLHHLEHALSPLALPGCHCLQHVPLAQTVVELAQHALLAALESRHAHTADQAERLFQSNLQSFLLAYEPNCQLEHCPETSTSRHHDPPAALPVQPHTGLSVHAEEGLKDALDDPGVDGQQDANGLVYCFLLDWAALLLETDPLGGWLEGVDLIYVML